MEAGLSNHTSKPSSEDLSRDPYRVIAVHGTFAGNANKVDTSAIEWWESENPFAERLSNQLNVKAKDWHDFQWSGKNSDRERLGASEKLGKYFNSFNSADDKRTLIIAHSHGGNVVFDWLMRQSLPRDANLQIITVGTPFFHVRRNHIASFIFKILLMILVAFAGSFLLLSIIGDIAPINERRSRFDFSDQLLTTFFWPSFCVLLIILCWKIVARFLKDERSWKNRHRPLPSHVDVFCLHHPQDEAINFLARDLGADVQLTYMLQAFLFKLYPLVWLLFIFVLYQLEDVQTSLRSLPDLGWVFTTAGLMASGPIIMALGLTAFAQRISDGIASFSFNKLARNVSWGNDVGRITSVSSAPEVTPRPIARHRPETYFEGLQKRALDRAKDDADQALISGKGAMLRHLSAESGSLIEAARANPKLADALIHCNYFNAELANAIALIAQERLSNT